MEIPGTKPFIPKAFITFDVLVLNYEKKKLAFYFQMNNNGSLSFRTNKEMVLKARIKNFYGQLHSPFFIRVAL